MDTEILSPTGDNAQWVPMPGDIAPSVATIPDHNPIPTVSRHSSPIMNVQAPVAFASADPQVMGQHFFAESMVPGQTPLLTPTSGVTIHPSPMECQLLKWLISHLLPCQGFS